MNRNFEKIVEDTRLWLQSSSRPKPSIRNEVARYGFVRRAHTIIQEPTEHVVAVEHNTLFTGKKIGAIALQPVEADLAPILFRWEDNDYTVMSELTYNPSQPVNLNRLSGVILDAIYGRIAPAMNVINLQRIIDSTR